MGDTEVLEQDEVHRVVQTPKSRWLTQAASLEVVSILDKRPATAEDIRDWFFHRWGKKIMDTLLAISKAPARRMARYVGLASQINHSSWLEYIIPIQADDLYCLSTGKNPKDSENVFHELYNIFVWIGTVEWFMRKNELQEWYHTPDETGKTGRDYIALAIEDDFWSTWKGIVAAINGKRKVHNQWLLSGARSNLVKQAWNKLASLADFFEAMGEEKAVSKQLLKEYEKIWQARQQARSAKREVATRKKAEWLNNLSADTRRQVLANAGERRIIKTSLGDYEEPEVPSLKNWGKMDPGYITDLRTRLRAYKSGVSRKVTWSDLLGGLSKEARVYFSLFLKALKHIWVPENMMTTEYIQFSLTKAGSGIIKLEKFLIKEIGRRLLIEAMERTTESAKKILFGLDGEDVILKIVPLLKKDSEDKEKGK